MARRQTCHVRRLHRVHLALGKRDGMGQKLMDFTKSMDAVDDKTFTLKEPHGLVLDSLGKISSNTPFMMPKRPLK